MRAINHLFVTPRMWQMATAGGLHCSSLLRSESTCLSCQSPSSTSESNEKSFKFDVIWVFHSIPHLAWRTLLLVILGLVLCTCSDEAEFVGSTIETQPMGNRHWEVDDDILWILMQSSLKRNRFVFEGPPVENHSMRRHGLNQ